MKLTYTLQCEIDEPLPGPRPDDAQLTEEIKSALTAILSRLPYVVRDVRVWAKASPYMGKSLVVDRIEPTSAGRFRVVVTDADNQTTTRTFPTWGAAQAWADKIDPLPLP